MNNFKELFPLIFYINLDSRPDRRENAEKEFERVGLSPIRLSGTTISGTPNYKVNGMLGCTLSHIRALLIAKEQNKNVFIFEDDVKFINDFENIVEGACTQINDFDWTLFYLGGNILKPFEQCSENLAKLNHCQSTVSYGVNKSNLDQVITQLLLNQTAMLNDGRRMVRPIDTIYADIVIPNTRCFIVAPEMVVIQKDSYSDIEMRDVKYESYLERRYNENFVSL